MPNNTKKPLYSYFLMVIFFICTSTINTITCNTDTCYVIYCWCIYKQLSTFTNMTIAENCLWGFFWCLFFFLMKKSTEILKWYLGITREYRSYTFTMALMTGELRFTILLSSNWAEVLVIVAGLICKIGIVSTIGLCELWSCSCETIYSSEREFIALWNNLWIWLCRPSCM